MIPYEYNYYLAMSLYSRLGIYQQKVRPPLHVPSSFSVFTFSNIISRDVSTGINGLKIDRGGFLVFRTLDDRLLEYLKLGLALNPVLKIADTSFTVKSVKEVEQNEMQGELEFRTLSPVLIRDFSDGRKYVVDPPDRIEENLNLTTEWFLKNKLGVQEPPRVKIEIFKSHRKTARISSNAGKNSITTCFNLAGKITGNPSDILLLYYRGPGIEDRPGSGVLGGELNGRDECKADPKQYREPSVQSAYQCSWRRWWRAYGTKRIGTKRRRVANGKTLHGHHGRGSTTSRT